VRFQRVWLSGEEESYRQCPYVFTKKAANSKGHYMLSGCTKLRLPSWLQAVVKKRSIKNTVG